MITTTTLRSNSTFGLLILLFFLNGTNACLNAMGKPEPPRDHTETGICSVAETPDLNGNGIIDGGETRVCAITRAEAYCDANLDFNSSCEAAGGDPSTSCNDPGPDGGCITTNNPITGALLGSSCSCTCTCE